MGEPFHILLAFVLAAIPSVALCRAMMAMRVMDAPTEARKIQKAPVPTLGGIAVAVSTILATVAVTEFTDFPLDDAILLMSSGALACLLIGLADDVLKLRAPVRLVLIGGVAIGVTAFGVRADAMGFWPGAMIQLPLFAAIAGSAFWLVVVVNAVNFMDGANGLAMGMASAAAAGLAVCAAFTGVWDVALLAGALAGALGGFLVWNVPGKLFVGDTGAYFTGAALGGLGLEFVQARPDLLFVPPLLLLPFLSDVLLTLAWRSMHGKKLFEAHRDHTYQIAMKAGLRHWQVALVHAFWSVNAAVIAVAAAILGGHLPVIAFVALVVVSVWIHWRVRSSGVKAGLVGADIP